jgi:hypothetical protein
LINVPYFRPPFSQAKRKEWNSDLPLAVDY